MAKKYDYSDLHYDGDVKKLLKVMGKNIETYLELIQQYAIFEGVQEEEFQKTLKTCRKLIKKLKDGDPSVIDTDTFNDIVDSGSPIIISHALGDGD